MTHADPSPDYPRYSFVHALTRLVGRCAQLAVDEEVRQELNSTYNNLRRIDSEAHELATQLTSNPDWWTATGLFLDQSRAGWLRRLSQARESGERLDRSSFSSELASAMDATVAFFGMSTRLILRSEYDQDFSRSSDSYADAGAGEALGGQVRNEPSATPEDFDYVSVNYCTTRARTDVSRRGQPLFYSSESSKRTEYGVARVSLPKGRKKGQIPAPKLVALEYNWNPRKHVMVVSASPETEGDFYRRLAAAEKDSPSSARRALVFVHGFTVTFVDALRRCGQIYKDTGFAGTPICFSWPAQERFDPLSYAHASTEADLAPKALGQMLQDLASSGVDEIYLLAHSMGNKVAVDVLKEWATSRHHACPLLKEIVLAAPDIGRDYFVERIGPALKSAYRAVTLYASSKDRPLRMSKWLNGGQRAGDMEPDPVVLDHVETIDASAMGEDIFLHSYIADSRSLLMDLYQLFEHRTRAAKRFGMATQVAAGGTYWVLEP
jgi:esterase/lipase superfamily enzyme